MHIFICKFSIIINLNLLSQHYLFLFFSIFMFLNAAINLLICFVCFCVPKRVGNFVSLDKQKIFTYD